VGGEVATGVTMESMECEGEEYSCCEKPNNETVGYVIGVKDRWNGVKLYICNHILSLHLRV